LFAAAAIIALSAAARGLADDQVSLFFAVALFGIGAPKLVSLWFEGPDRGLAMGIYITGPALGGISALALTNSVVMPLMGGDWRQVLFLYAGIGLAIGLVWLMLASHPRARHLPGLAVAEKSPSAEYGGQIGVFLELLKIPAVRLMLIMAVGAFFFNHGLNNWLPEILRRGGMTAAQAGYWAAIPTAIGVFSSLLIPRFATPAVDTGRPDPGRRADGAVVAVRRERPGPHPWTGPAGRGARLHDDGHDAGPGGDSGRGQPSCGHGGGHVLFRRRNRRCPGPACPGRAV
jgi:cyanate permease